MQGTTALQSISTEELIKDALLYIFDQNTESIDFHSIVGELKTRLRL